MSKASQLIDKYSSKYDVSRKKVREIVESGVKYGMSMERIEIGIRLALGKGDEVFTTKDLAAALGTTVDEATQEAFKASEYLRS